MPGTGYGNPLRGKNAANIIRISPNMDVIREIFVSLDVMIRQILLRVNVDQKGLSEYHGTEYFDKLSGKYIATLFDRLGLMYIATYFRAYFIPDLPGADETEKLNAIFEKAPLWLLWFTHCDVYGRILGLKLPDFASAHNSHQGNSNGLVRCREGLLSGVHYRMVK